MKFYLESLGCAKNLVDSEIAARHLEESGYEQVFDVASADLIVVNTCAFIKSAKEEAINTILELASFKEGRCTTLAVMGCLPERYRDELPALLPEVDLWTGTRDFHRLAELLGSRERSAYSAEPVPYESLERKILTPPHWAYLKISEGCNHRCAFCAIPSLRGAYRSRSVESVNAEARRLAEGGAAEIVLVSQDSTAYGADLYGRPSLPLLLRELSSIENLQWIRFLYCNPQAVTDELLEAMASSPKICRYLDIPLQHVSPGILRKMGRGGSCGEFLDLVRRARKNLPGIALRSTFIVGFPHEGSEDHERLLSFLEEARLDRVGIFAFSREEGTAAWAMKPRVPVRVAEARLREAMLLQQRISLEKGRELIGTSVEVLVEGPLTGTPDVRGLVCEGGRGNGFLRSLSHVGRSRRDAPEVDGKVFFRGSAGAGEIVSVRITGATPYDLFGESTARG